MPAEEYRFEVHWKPFMLDASLPAEGVDKLQRYNAKFGPARVQQMLPHMKRVGEGEGIAFSYGGLIGNTLDSHRMIEWSARFGKQNEMVEELFSRYFEQEQNMGDRRVLAEAAAKVGL